MKFRARTLLWIVNKFRFKNKVEKAAIYGLTGQDYNHKTRQGFPREASWCQRWVRCVLFLAFGNRHADLMRRSARETALEVAKSQYALRPFERDEPGDVWWWLEGPGRDGHAAIRVGSEGLAQNTERGNDSGDARVILRISEMRPPDVRARFS
jgi:hypothetical protein